MNDYKKSVILRHEDRIYKDVHDLEDILHHLESKNIIHDQKDIVNAKNSTAMLIKVLLSKTDGPWFEEFISALSKDFNWISNAIKEEFDNAREEKITHYLNGRGGVPPLPHHNVTRKLYVQKLRDKIRSLNRHDYLVVLGMSGLGKTCLVVDALHDINLLEQSLKGCVYWMSVGDIKTEELDDSQCLNLKKKLCDMADLRINPQQDLSIQLKKHFSLQPNVSALLVLDKVRSSKVVEVFDVGCKILVTTQDRDVVKNEIRKEFFRIDDGFSESESVQVLTDFVLDESAAQIHRAWKGHPMAIGLIRGELSETHQNSRRSPSQSKEYLQPALLEDNDNVIRRRSIVEKSISSLIDLTTKRLPNYCKTYFDMLAVLVEDTNITIEVLKILWGMSKGEAENTMGQLHRRSLVFQKFNDHLKMPVYGIHDIIMEYLKKNKSSSDLQKMHEGLISKIDAACANNFADLPQDSYIYSYLCHHVENAKQWEQFRCQFFSLRYIESKLKATDPGNLLHDLNKYQESLEGGNSEYQAKLRNIKSLVSDNGWDIHQNEMDIVQCALLQPKNSLLYIEAACIASKRNPSKVYFNPNNTWERAKDLESKSPNVKAVSLVVNNSPNHIDGRVLAYPDQNGLIVELDMHFRQTRRSFKESSPVVVLKMSPLYDNFLSALSDGSINIWSLASDTSCNADTPPPRLRQRSHQSFFEETRTTPVATFNHKRSVICACFSNDGKLVVSASEDGAVRVWNVEEKKCILKKNVHPSPSAIACTFLCGDKMIVYGVKDFKIFFLDLISNQTYSLDIDRRFGDLVTLLCTRDKFKNLIVVQEKNVLLYSWQDVTLGHIREGHRKLDFNGLRSYIRHSEDTIITCATYHPKHRLLLGTQNGCRLFFDVFNKNCLPLCFGSGAVKAVDMVNSRVVFAQKDSVKMRWLDSDSKLSAVKQMGGGHLGWTSRNLSVYTTFTSDGNIQVYHEGKLLAEYLCKEVCIVRVGPQGDDILIGTSDGKVKLFDLISKTTISLPFEFSSRIMYLSATMYGKKPVCLAAAKTRDDDKSYTFQAIGYNNYSYIKSVNIYAPVVKTFICSNKHCLVAVLCDYSILAWDLSQAAFFLVQEGRKSAKLTDACLSKDENELVLSDEENCFHQISLSWPQDENNTPSNNISSERSMPQKPTRLALNLPLTTNQGTDEVDGIRMSPPKITLTGSLKTRQLYAPSWCCCICPKGKVIAIGYDESKVVVWDLKSKEPILNFDVFPNRHTKVGQLQFSPYDVKLGDNEYHLTLWVVTDFVSVWDLSPFITDNAVYGKANTTQVQPKCLGCVSVAGNPIIELSTNQSFDKFSAFDEFGSYFLWNVWVFEEMKVSSDASESKLCSEGEVQDN